MTTIEKQRTAMRHALDCLDAIDRLTAILERIGPAADLNAQLKGLYDEYADNMADLMKTFFVPQALEAV